MAKTYRVFVNDNGVHDAVPEGFSIAGFFFGFFWVLYKRLWLLAVIIMFSYVLVYIVGIKIVIFLFNLGISIFIGIKGNELVVNALIRKGYKEISKVEASGIDDAISNFEQPAKITADERLKPNEIAVRCANCGTELIVEVNEGETPEFICPKCNEENEIVEEKE